MVDTSKYRITLNCKFEKALAAPPVFARSVSDEAISPPAPSQEIATPSARNDRAGGQAVTNHVNEHNHGSLMDFVEKIEENIKW